MRARVLDISEEQNWDIFVKKHPLGNIHQSAAWGQFQESIPSRGMYFIVVIEDDDKKIIGGAMIVKYRLPKGFCWFYAPRGPLMDFQALDLNYQMGLLLNAIKDLADREKAVFFRIDPLIIDHSTLKYQELLNFRYTKAGFQPQTTLILDLKEKEEALLAQMKPKGRYNIRLAEKKGVEVVCYKNNDEVPQGDIDAFYEIFQETTARDGFRGHDKSYYEKMIRGLLPMGLGRFYVAKYEGEIIAGMITTQYNDTAIYYYGASSNRHRNVMAPYLLQWTAIKDARAMGLRMYDFLGIASSDNPSDPWFGITQFKTKFGGHPVRYRPAMEHAFKPLLYWAYRVLKFVRR